LLEIDRAFFKNGKDWIFMTSGTNNDRESEVNRTASLDGFVFACEVGLREWFGLVNRDCIPDTRLGLDSPLHYSFLTRLFARANVRGMGLSFGYIPTHNETKGTKPRQKQKGTDATFAYCEYDTIRPEAKQYLVFRLPRVISFKPESTL
jgi:hypothetical protein